MPAEDLTAEPGRLDAVVARLAGVPRADVQRAIADGRVTVDGARRPKSFSLAGGERLRVEIPPVPDVPPEGPAVPVRFRDAHLLVVAKPSGMPTHPTAGRRTGTLVNRLKGMRLGLAAAGGPLRPGIVHRLDAGTSGLMIVAITDRAFEELVSMMKRHEVDRRYFALVRGEVEHAFAVDAPLVRRGARIAAGAGRGRPARTEFEVRGRFPGATLLEATPLTGRTHQIRVHLSSIGHPVLGDRAYGGAGSDARALGLVRPFLHSWRLAFTHPITGERVEVQEPLPPDLDRALDLAGDP